MKKETNQYQVIMLQTQLDEQGAIWKFDNAKPLIASQGKLTSDLPFKEFHLYAVPRFKNIELEPNEIIKAKDWFIHDKDVLLCDSITEDGRITTRRFPHITLHPTVCHKIIASTDKNITPIKILPKSYVDFYVDIANDSGVPFDYVSLKMEDNALLTKETYIKHTTFGESFLDTKINPNNEVIVDYFSSDNKTITITVKQAEELYCLGRLDKIASNNGGCYIDNSEEWIKKHIK